MRLIRNSGWIPASLHLCSSWSLPLLIDTFCSLLNVSGLPGMWIRHWGCRPDDLLRVRLLQREQCSAAGKRPLTSFTLILQMSLLFICGSNSLCSTWLPVLRNHNYFLRFRFRLLTSYGSGSDFWQVTVPAPAPYLDQGKNWYVSLNLL